MVFKVLKIEACYLMTKSLTNSEFRVDVHSCANCMLVIISMSVFSNDLPVTLCWYLCIISK